MEQNQSISELDEFSLRVLLFLSSGNKSTVSVINRVIGDDNAVRFGIDILEKKYHFIGRDSINNFQLTEAGADYLRFNHWIPMIKSTPSTTPKKIEIEQKHRQIVSLADFFVIAAIPIWASIPIIIGSIILIGFALTNTTGKVVLILVLILFLGTYFRWTFQTVTEGEKLVVFRWGKCIGAQGPGPVLVIPFIDKTKLVNVKLENREISKEPCITKDNVQIDVDFVYYWKIDDAEKSVTQVTNAAESIKLLATGALRATVAGFDFSNLQEQRQSLNEKLKNEIDVHSVDWGIYVTNVEIQEVKTSPEIKTAMEDWRAAKWRSETLIKMAEGQAEALKLLREAAYNIDGNTLNLKYFEMLEKLGDGRATKFILPIELTNLVKSWIQQIEQNQKGNEQDDHSNRTKLE